MIRVRRLLFAALFLAGLAVPAGAAAEGGTIDVLIAESSRHHVEEMQLLKSLLDQQRRLVVLQQAPQETAAQLALLTAGIAAPAAAPPVPANPPPREVPDLLEAALARMEQRVNPLLALLFIAWLLTLGLQVRTQRELRALRRAAQPDAPLPKAPAEEGTPESGRPVLRLLPEDDHWTISNVGSYQAEGIRLYVGSNPSMKQRKKSIKTLPPGEAVLVTLPPGEFPTGLYATLEYRHPVTTRLYKEQFLLHEEAPTTQVRASAPPLPGKISSLHSRR